MHRVFEHNTGLKGAKCLRGQRPVTLVWVSDGQTKSQALKFENRIKKLSHKDKVLFIERGRNEKEKEK
ncbi:GIY-YIG nuclease family protein [Candidatus Bathyarchaeota archaeon]|nr:GIY-YIG nuclease family protein [Candidatus Bathyarchaeota archaeon]